MASSKVKAKARNAATSRSSSSSGKMQQGSKTQAQSRMGDAARRAAQAAQQRQAQSQAAAARAAAEAAARAKAERDARVQAAEEAAAQRAKDAFAAYQARRKGGGKGQIGVTQRPAPPPLFRMPTAGVMPTYQTGSAAEGYYIPPLGGMGLPSGSMGSYGAQTYKTIPQQKGRRAGAGGMQVQYVRQPYGRPPARTKWEQVAWREEMFNRQDRGMAPFKMDYPQTAALPTQDYADYGYDTGGEYEPYPYVDGGGGDYEEKNFQPQWYNRLVNWSVNR